MKAQVLRSTSCWLGKTIVVFVVAFVVFVVGHSWGCKQSRCVRCGRSESGNLFVRASLENEINKNRHAY